jgi:hypothetical protein
MKPIASPLNIIDFAIMNFEFNFVQPNEKAKEIDLRDCFNNYELDIDFWIHANEVIQVSIKAEINRDKKLPGYSIFAEAACIFEFNKSIEITDDARKSIEGFSTIYIALNSLRGFISQVTASAPFGRYILPSVDLNNLINQKKLSVTGENKKSPVKKLSKKK